MNILKRRAASTINSVLHKFGVEVVALSHLKALEDKVGGALTPSYNQSQLPVGVNGDLRTDNPRLQELKRRYLSHPAARHSLWSEKYLRDELQLEYFRGDNAYLYQKRLSNEAAYILTTYYALSIDKLGLLQRLDDDDLFGNYLVKFDDTLLVSRDLLDSVIEINFLDQTLDLSNLSGVKVLDIGAGYGRLAYRLAQAFPTLEHIFCTDAVAESTFISEFYLKFRGVSDRAIVVPLDEIEQTLQQHSIDIVTNVHSFGECSLESITWWLDLIAKHRVKYLFIVANGEGLGSRELDDTNIDYMPAITARGYQLVVKQPKYHRTSSVQKYGAYPTYYYLFELPS